MPLDPNDIDDVPMLLVNFESEYGGDHNNVVNVIVMRLIREKTHIPLSWMLVLAYLSLPPYPWFVRKVAFVLSMKLVQIVKISSRSVMSSSSDGRSLTYILVRDEIRYVIDGNTVYTRYQENGEN